MEKSNSFNNNKINESLVKAIQIKASSLCPNPDIDGEELISYERAESIADAFLTVYPEYADKEVSLDDYKFNSDFEEYRLL